MEQSDIRWNEEARTKILTDADTVLRDAVIELSTTMSGKSSNEVYEALNAKLKDRFIDYKPGPDVRKYADAIVDGEFAGEDTDDEQVNDG